MAINETGTIFKSLRFDGQDSRDYGVYITGAGTYNAPERDVEMVTIPARNGAFPLDNGRFNNITVTYPAGIFADTEEDFAQAISDFRNMLCSRSGYVRLEDDYNPDEYRLAIFKSGLEVNAVNLQAAEFELVFECKPQRFLTSGEQEITVTSGDTLTSPTGFDSAPLIETRGYGSMVVGGYPIQLTSEQFGRLNLDGCITQTQTAIAVDYSSYIPKVDFGDTITVVRPSFTFNINTGGDELVYGSLQFSEVQSSEQFNWVFRDEYLSSNSAFGTFTIYPTLTAPAKEASLIEAEFSLTGRVVTNGQTQTFTASLYLTVSNSYTPSQEQAAWVFRVTGLDSIPYETLLSYDIESAYVDSTASVLGHPTYIDCDYGEAYKIEDGQAVSLNRYIALGSELPVISTAGTTITYDNTFTSVKVVPRWWKI